MTGMTSGSDPGGGMSAITGGRTPAQVSVDQIRSDLSVSDLVTRTRKGEQQARDALIERHAPLVWSICLTRWLDGADACPNLPPGRTAVIAASGQLRIPCERLMDTTWLAPHRRWPSPRAQARGCRPAASHLPVRPDSPIIGPLAARASIRKEQTPCTLDTCHGQDHRISGSLRVLGPGRGCSPAWPWFFPP